MGSDPIVLSFYDSIIRQSDVDILEGPHWLTDTLIGFYFEYLSNVAYKDEARLLFIGPEVTQCLKVSNVCPNVLVCLFKVLLIHSNFY